MGDEICIFLLDPLIFKFSINNEDMEAFPIEIINKKIQNCSNKYPV